MKTISSLYISLFLCLSSYAQKDTICLFDNYVVLNDKIYNETVSGLNEGEWINFKIKKIESINVLWCGIDENGNPTSSSYSIVIDYKPSNGIKPLKNFDQNGIFQDSTITLNCIPPSQYFIESTGNYEGGRKSGIWKTFYASGKAIHTVGFENGVPVKGFDIFRENGSLMMRVKLGKTDKYTVLKYDESMKLLETTSISQGDLINLID